MKNRNVQISQDVEARYLKLEVAVRYDEEDMPNDAPLRDGKMWRATIDLVTHKVADWPRNGPGLHIEYMKVTDEGTYILLDEAMKEIKRIEGYVPNSLLPGDYGDYLSLDISEDGTIKNWLPDADLSNFEDAEQ